MQLQVEELTETPSPLTPQSCLVPMYQCYSPLWGPQNYWLPFSQHDQLLGGVYYQPWMYNYQGYPAVPHSQQPMQECVFLETSCYPYVETESSVIQEVKDDATTNASRECSGEVVELTEESVPVTSHDVSDTPTPSGLNGSIVNSLPNPTATTIVPSTEQSDPEDAGIGTFVSSGCWYPRSPNGTPDNFQHSTPVKTLFQTARRPSRTARQNHSPSRHTNIDLRSRFRPKAMERQRHGFYNCFHRLDLPERTLGRPSLLQSRRIKGQPCVEDAWINHMNLLFRNLPDPWVMNACHRYENLSNWLTFKDYSKVRFYCKNCENGWTSMHGMVLFYFRWNRRMMRGEILYRINGQKCASCNPNTYELPLWYPEEVQKTITNLYYKISTDIYGLVTPKYIRTRRPGKPAMSHNVNLCQGCLNGVCSIGSSKHVVI